MSEERDIKRCGGCGWKNGNEVEAGGIYYCPNKFCFASGAWGPRLEASYQDDKGEQTGEQIIRMREDVRKELLALVPQRNKNAETRNVVRALLRSRRRIERKYAEAVMNTVEEAANAVVTK